MIYLDDNFYPRTVTVRRAVSGFSESGNFTGRLDVVTDNLPADIQLSLQVRRMAATDRRGMSEDTVWLMFCEPPVPLVIGDLVEDEESGTSYRIDAAGDWGDHTECVMRLITR